MYYEIVGIWWVEGRGRGRKNGREIFFKPCLAAGSHDVASCCFRSQIFSHPSPSFSLSCPLCCLQPYRILVYNVNRGTRIRLLSRLLRASSQNSICFFVWFNKIFNSHHIHTIYLQLSFPWFFLLRNKCIASIDTFENKSNRQVEHRLFQVCWCSIISCLSWPQKSTSVSNELCGKLRNNSSCRFGEWILFFLSLNIQGRKSENSVRKFREIEKESCEMLFEMFCNWKGIRSRLLKPHCLFSLLRAISMRVFVYTIYV